MKSNVGLVMLFGLGALGFQACSSGVSLDCRADCEKSEQCCGTYPNCEPWDESRMQECLCTCGNIELTATDEFLRGKAECNKMSCEGEERSICIYRLMAGCDIGLTPAAEAYCTRADDCSVDDEFDECVQTMGVMMGCYNETVHEATISCSSLGTCEAFPTEFETCLDAHTGVVECFPVD